MALSFLQPKKSPKKPTLFNVIYKHFGISGVTQGSLFIYASYSYAAEEKAMKMLRQRKNLWGNIVFTIKEVY